MWGTNMLGASVLFDSLTMAQIINVRRGGMLGLPQLSMVF